MTDHERGYDPYAEEPLAFDARQSRGRRGFPTALVVSLVILIGLGAAIFSFYRSGVRGAGAGPAPVGTPIGDIKAAPPAQTQAPPDAASGLQIYKSEGAAPANPAAEFGPGPEQPAPRPAPVAPVQAQPIPAVPVSPAAVAASGATAPAAPQPVVSAPAAKPAAPQVKLAEAKPAPAKPLHAKPQDDVSALLDGGPPAAAPAPVKAEPARIAPADHGGALAQIGAYSSEALAKKGLGDLAAAYGGDLAGKHWIVEPVARDGKTLYRASVSGFASRTAAADFCGKLKAASKACIVR